MTVTEPAIKHADISTINTPDMLAYGQTSYAVLSANRAWNVEFWHGKFDGVLIRRVGYSRRWIPWAT